MNFYDNETNIISDFQLIPEAMVFFPLESGEAKSVFHSIYKTEQWRFWLNSSGKSDPPPDFYSIKHNLMMDVMRVDDRTRPNEKGRLCNPTNQRESQIQKEIRESGILDAFPNVQEVFVNAVTNLPAYEDHNYQFYYSSFARTIKKHIESISLYKKNHPEYKVIFFVFDESSGYVQVDDKELVKRGIHE